MTSETTPQGAVSYTYDAAGHRASMTVAGQPAIGYSYDLAGRLTQIAQGASTVGFTYDNASRRSTLTLPNGVTVAYSFDAASQLTGLTYSLGQTRLGNLTYAYDSAGRRASAGGSFARTGLPLALSSATYNANNQLTQWGTAALTYDLNGNLTGDGVNNYTWDARNQLASITAVSGGSTIGTFQYDAFGRRASKTVIGTTTSFLYDRVNAVQELSGSTPTAHLLTGGVDEFFSRADSSGTFAPLTDALGSTIALTDSTGAVQTQYTYEPFGATSVSGQGNGNLFRYTGREDDGTGVYFYCARYYSPVYQRSISEDPIGLAGGINRYGYVGGNPLRYRDPFGLSASSAASCFLEGAAVGAVGAVVVGAVAVGVAALGAPVAAVTVGLGAVAVVGGVALGLDVKGQIAAGNWDGLAYDLGSAVGAIVVGGFGGRAIAEGINGVPSPPWSWNSDVGDMYDPNFPGGSAGKWFGKGPNPASAGGSAAGAGAGAATAGRGACGGC